MPAAPKVSVQEIVNSLLKWRGNVNAAAEELGIRRNNLDDRIRVLGLDIRLFRKGGTGITPFTPMTPLPPPDNAPPSPQLRKSAGAPFSARGGRTNIAPVSSSAAAAVTEFLKKEPSRRAPRIPPHHLDKLTEAKYDLQALLRRDLSEGQILEMCLDDCLVSWIERKLAGLRRGEQPEKPPTEKDRRRRGEKA